MTDLTAHSRHENLDNINHMVAIGGGTRSWASDVRFKFYE